MVPAATALPLALRRTTVSPVTAIVADANKLWKLAEADPALGYQLSLTLIEALNGPVRSVPRPDDLTRSRMPCPRYLHTSFRGWGCLGSRWDWWAC
jgi:hypothetical protein